MNQFPTNSGDASEMASGLMTPSNPLIRSADHLDDSDDDFGGRTSRIRTSENINPEIPSVYSSNLRTLRTTEPSQDARDFMRRYFSNL